MVAESEVTKPMVNTRLAKDYISMYHALFEHARDCIMFFDVSGHVLEVNKITLQTYGYEHHEIIGIHVTSLRAPETINLLEEQFQLALRQGLIFESLHRRKDGTVFPVEVSATAAEVGGERVVMSIVRDVTDRVNREAELRKLSAAVEQSPCSVVITDLEGNIEYVNPKFTQATGYSRSEVVGLNPRVLKSGRQPPEVYKNLWDLITSGREWRGEFQNVTKNGTLFWEFASISPIRDATGKSTHYLAIKEDITARKQLEESVQRDMELARRIQRELLPPELDNVFLSIRTIYQPNYHVSGDLFDYSWDEQARSLSGYLADVMGHGVGTALQAAALRVLFHQAKEQQLSPAETLHWVNSRISAYVAEDTFAAAVYFQLEYTQQKFCFATAGINHLFHWSQDGRLLARPGAYLGILDEGGYENHELTVNTGDCLILLTDGLFDIIDDRQAMAALAPEQAWDFLGSLIKENRAIDDASALFITIK